MDSYPQCLHHRRLLLQPRFRAALKSNGPELVAKLSAAQFSHWSTWCGAFFYRTSSMCIDALRPFLGPEVSHQRHCPLRFVGERTRLRC